MNDDSDWKRAYAQREAMRAWTTDADADADMCFALCNSTCPTG